jgi:hypothetical protein
MNAPHKITASMPTQLALSLSVLGITPDRDLTEQAERLFIRAAGEKVRLVRAVEAGGIARPRANTLLERLNWSVENTPLVCANASNTTALHSFLRDYGAAIDAVCRTADFIRMDRELAA